MSVDIRADDVLLTPKDVMARFQISEGTLNNWRLRGWGQRMCVLVVAFGTLSGAVLAWLNQGVVPA